MSCWVSERSERSNVLGPSLLNGLFPMGPQVFQTPVFPLLVHDLHFMQAWPSSSLSSWRLLFSFQASSLHAYCPPTFRILLPIPFFSFPPQRGNFSPFILADDNSFAPHPLQSALLSAMQARMCTMAMRLFCPLSWCSPKIPELLTFRMPTSPTDEGDRHLPPLPIS